MAAVTIDPPIRIGTGTGVIVDHDHAHKGGVCHIWRDGRIVCTQQSWPKLRTHTPREPCGYPPCRRCDEITGNYR